MNKSHQVRGGLRVIRGEAEAEGEGEGEGVEREVFVFRDALGDQTSDLDCNTRRFHGTVTVAPCLNVGVGWGGFLVGLSGGPRNDTDVQCMGPGWGAPLFQWLSSMYSRVQSPRSVYQMSISAQRILRSSNM